MKLSCDTVRDLLPAYTGKTASATTMRLVKEHLRGCPDCRNELEAMHRPAYTPVQREAAAHEINYLGLSRRLRRRRITIAVLVLLAAVWAVLFTIDYARFSQGESLKFAIHSHQDYGEEGTVDVYYGLGYKMTDYKLTRGRGDRAFGTLLMRTDTALLTEEELVQLEDAAGAWIQEHEKDAASPIPEGRIIIGEASAGDVLGIEDYGTEHAVIYIHAILEKVDDQGVSHGFSGHDMYRIEADMRTHPMRIQSMESYESMISDITFKNAPQNYEEYIAEYKKQLSGKVPGYVIDATGMYDFSYIMERIHQKAWAIHADYLTARGEEGQP